MLPAIALRKTLDWIDGVPSEAPLPAMPGFDRDWIESLLDGKLDGWASLTVEQALEMTIEWVEAVPVDIRATLPPFDVSAPKAIAK
ncbi:hypothetical protein QAO71_16850 (plasmid) [Halopseudomonas sp. SMJS2]|uniref:hypothetical protein n=1 Tax=Halopseudomonas sp. SMJS2 TaxID=3041098 RepID=UPI0024534D04|nr:hypothetical protein [Halopseudomonas sp. SMJS2]WGK63440.1 hypothetical protein QAO71_16850 [Halopseudomonas sp. SMJS2]